MIIDSGSSIRPRLNSKKTESTTEGVIIDCSVNNTLYLSTTSVTEAFRFFNQRRGKGQSLHMAFRRLAELQKL